MTLGPLTAPLQVDFDYTRSLGPVLRVFATGLRDGLLIGGRTPDGVVVPPAEFVDGQATTEFVTVGPSGTVESWAWVSDPVAGQPFSHPFAFALIRLDGANTAILHAVDAGSPDVMATGLRVTARWATERTGSITDVWFVPGADVVAATAQESAPVVESIVTPVHLTYTYAASAEESAFFRGLAEGRLLGQRCPVCRQVYIPPRGACPVDGVPTTAEVELPDTGVVTTFCIVNVPFLGQRITPPYVSAYVLLDGADIAFLHLVLGVDASEVRMGMRVRAVWRPREEWSTSLENISHFEPTGEPDAAFEAIRSHL